MNDQIIMLGPGRDARKTKISERMTNVQRLLGFQMNPAGAHDFFSADVLVAVSEVQTNKSNQSSPRANPFRFGVITSLVQPFHICALRTPSNCHGRLTRYQYGQKQVPRCFQRWRCGPYFGNGGPGPRELLRRSAQRIREARTGCTENPFAQFVHPICIEARGD